MSPLAGGPPRLGFVWGSVCVRRAVGPDSLLVAGSQHPRGGAGESSSVH